MKIAEVCDECGKSLEPFEPKALMKDKGVLCWSCYEKEPVK